MRKKIKYSIIFSLLLAFWPILSGAVEIFGNKVQGGFIFGHTAPHADIQMGGLSTQAGSDGAFVIGIDRNAEEALTLEIKTPAKSEKQVVFIEKRDYETQKINGIAKRKVNPNEADMKVIEQDSSKIAQARNYFSELSYAFETPRLPANGPKSGVYGSRRVFNGEERSWHKGMDIAAPKGSDVFAPVGGKVRLALENSFFNGNLIILDHGYNLMSIYAHLDTMRVKVGDTVKKGDIIGTVGQTGRATGPHLHWGLYWKNMALDPELWVNMK